MATGTFGTSPVLDHFTTDVTLSPSWTTPALGEPAMELDTTAHDFTGTVNDWGAALWNLTTFNSPVEAYATIVANTGDGDANLYADVSGGTSGTVHPTSGYFADFGGTGSVGSPSTVSVWRIDGPQDTTRLSFVATPYSNLQPGDAIGLSVSGEVVTAWYKAAGASSWQAVDSGIDPAPYTGGNIAIEALPGIDYGFGEFGGGASSVSSTVTSTSMAPQTDTVTAGGKVTYTATVSPAPSSSGGSVEFLNTTTSPAKVISGCSAQPINAAGQATCTQTYSTLGTYTTGAIYTGSPDGSFAGSTNVGDATITVANSPNSTATSSRFSASSATPLTGTTVTYTTQVSPVPNGGTVSFSDGGSPITACSAVTVTKGTATCKVAYKASGTHTITSSYLGNAAYAPSTTPASTVTVSSAPGFSIKRHELILTPACPARSGNCRFTIGVSITLPHVKHPVSLKHQLAVVLAGHKGQLVFHLSGKTQSTVAKYVLHHRKARLGVSVTLSVSDGDGSAGTQSASETIHGSSNLKKL